MTGFQELFGAGSPGSGENRAILLPWELYSTCPVGKSRRRAVQVSLPLVEGCEPEGSWVREFEPGSYSKNKVGLDQKGKLPPSLSVFPATHRTLLLGSRQPGASILVMREVILLAREFAGKSGPALHPVARDRKST